MKRKLTKTEWLLLGVPLLFILALGGWQLLQPHAQAILIKKRYVPRLVIALPGRPNSIAYSPDGKLIAVATNSSPPMGGKMVASLFTGQVHLYDSNIGTLLQTFAPASTVRSIAFSPSGKMLAISQSFYVPDKKNPTETVMQNQVILWDIRLRRAIHTIKDKGAVFSVIFSPDGGTMVLEGSTVQVWRVRNPKLLQSFVVNSANIPIAISPDGKTLACGISQFHPNSKVALYSLRALKLLREVDCAKKSKGAEIISFSHDGKYLISAERKSTGITTVFDTHSWKKSILKNDEEDIESAAFSTNSKLVALSFRHGEKLQLFSAQSLLPLFTINTKEYSDDKVYVPECRSAVLFSPDGLTMLHRGTNRIKLWDISELN